MAGRRDCQHSTSLLPPARSMRRWEIIASSSPSRSSGITLSSSVELLSSSFFFLLFLNSFFFIFRFTFCLDFLSLVILSVLSLHNIFLILIFIHRNVLFSYSPPLSCLSRLAFPSPSVCADPPISFVILIPYRVS